MGDRATDDFGLERRFSLVPVCDLFVGVGDTEDRGFMQVFFKDTQSNFGWSYTLMLGASAHSFTFREILGAFREIHICIAAIVSTLD